MEIIKVMQKMKKPWKLIPQLNKKELEDVISIASDSYYNSGISLISDEIFDSLKERLEYLNPKSPILTKIGAPVRGKKVKLPYWMGSMDKIKSDEKVLKKWIQSFSGPYVISDKLDGISCLLVHKNSETKLYTRGDGTYGQDISHLLHLINIPKQALDNIKEMEIAIRGELIMTIENFVKYSKEKANARNMVGGIINSKPNSINRKEARDIDFIAYEIITIEKKSSSQMRVLRKLGFNVVYYDIYQDINLNILDRILKKRKRKSTYEIDGIIITDNNDYERNTDGNPSYSFAYKGVNQTANVKVVDVIWKPSKDGMIIPRIQIEKTRLSQVDIEYTTGFNAKFINDNKIGPGAIITLVRSGDTIPHILGIVKPAKKASLPTKYSYKWDKNHVHFVLEDASEHPEVIEQRLTKFVTEIGVDGMSKGIISKLAEAGVDTIPKLIQLTAEELLEIDGFKETLANKIYNNIQTALDKLDILTLMTASNIFGRGFGKKRIKSILEKYPDIVDEYTEKKRDMWFDRLVGIDGIDQITANNFLDGMRNFQKFYKKISKLTDVQPFEQDVKTDGLFKDQVVVFTGFRNPAWKSFIESEGGEMGSGVTRKTTMLVYKEGQESTGNYQKASQMKIKILSQSAFGKKYGLETAH